MSRQRYQKKTGEGEDQTELREWNVDFSEGFSQKSPTRKNKKVKGLGPREKTQGSEKSAAQGWERNEKKARYGRKKKKLSVDIKR